MTIRVTDHALLRFIERTGLAELETIREQLATSLDRARKMAGQIREGDYTVKVDGLAYVVRGGALVTVHPE